MPKVALSSQDRRALSARAGCDLRTVVGCYARAPMLLATWRAINAAAGELGLPQPPDHKPKQPERRP